MVSERMAPAWSTSCSSARSYDHARRRPPSPGEALASFPIYTRATDTARLLDDNKLQIEHVMPQTLGDGPHGAAWRQMLGPEWDRVHSRLVHTLGNLTLTGYNQPLSNSPYEVKRQEFAKSHLELNRYFAHSAIWDAEAIRRRGAHLAVRLAEIWPRPLQEGEQPAAGSVEWTAAELREFWNGLTARCQRALAA
ncbi:MAG: HNH endonuclease, partial [Chloroflexi bacterium]|nr:HNH endonuclease [Chloroflexota bacterium]